MRKRKVEYYSHNAEADAIVRNDRTVVFTLPIVLSNNREPRTNIYATHHYREWWKEMAYKCWLVAGKPKMAKASLRMKFFFPDRRKRDYTNYCANYGIKGILDGLKEHLIPDDCSEYLDFDGVRFFRDKDRPRMELWFATVEAAEQTPANEKKEGEEQ